MLYKKNTSETAQFPVGSSNSSGSQSPDRCPSLSSVVDFVRSAAERPVMLHRVLIVSFAHVMNPSVTYRETSFGDKLEQVGPQTDFLLVVTWSEGEGHLVVSAVQHVLVPLGEAVSDGLQDTMDLCGDGELRDDDGHWVGVFGQLPGAGQLHYLLVRVGGIRRWRFGVPKALDQGLNLVEVSLLPEQRRLFEITGKSEFRRAQKVQDVAEQGPISVDEVVPLSVPHRRQVSSEHGPQHGVRIAPQSGQRRAVNRATHVQGHTLPPHVSQVPVLHLRPFSQTT